MTERIPTQIIETANLTTPVRLAPAKAGGPIHIRSFGGRFRSLRLMFGGLLFALAPIPRQAELIAVKGKR